MQPPFPATKQQLAIEAQKLAGAGIRESLLRWHRSVNQMSGAFVILGGKLDQLSVGHLDEWLARCNALAKDMERVRKKIAPKKRK